MQGKGQARPPASGWARAPRTRVLALRTVHPSVCPSVCPPFRLLWDEDARGPAGATARRSERLGDSHLSYLAVTSHLLGAHQCELCSVWGKASSLAAPLEEKGSRQGLSWVERAPGGQSKQIPRVFSLSGEGNPDSALR